MSGSGVPERGAAVTRPPLGARLAPLLVFALALLAFAHRSAPGVTWEDAGELAACVHGLGVPHPPGYPLYVILGHLWLLVAGPLSDDPARLLNLFSAVCAAGAAAVLARLAVRLGAGAGVALAAGLLPCLAPTFAAQAVLTEVYAPAALVGALLLLVCATHPRPAAPGALLLGLGFATHPALLFLAPMVLAAGWRAGAQQGARLRTAISGTLALCAGLLPFLYVPLAAARAPAWSWGDARTPGAALAHVLRTPLDTGAAREWGPQAAFLAEQGFGQWPLVLGASALGLVVGRAHVPRGAMLVLVVGILSTGAGLLWAVDYPMDLEVNRVRLAGSYVPLVLLVSALAALGLVALEARFAPALPRLSGSPLWVLMVLGLGVAAGPSTLANAVDLRADDAAERYAMATLESCPPDAVLLLNRLGYEDVLHFPVLYLQEVRGARPDVVAIDRAMLPQRWYRDMLAQRAPDLAFPLQVLDNTFAAAPDLAATAQGRRATTRPFLQALIDGPRRVFSADRPVGLLEGRPAIPGPELWELLPAGGGTPPPAEIGPTSPWLPEVDRDPWTAELRRLARARERAERGGAGPPERR